MTRVFEKHELEAAADRASVAARADVLKRFYVPIVGSHCCNIAGVRDPEAKDLIVYDTKVVFRWEFSAPYVKGSVEQALVCALADNANGQRQQQHPCPLRRCFPSA